MMSFWPIALLAAVAIALAQLNVNVPGALRTEGASENLIYLAFLLVIALVWSFRGRRLELRPTVVAGLVWLAAFGGAFVVYAFRDDAAMFVDRMRGQVSPTLAVARTEGEVSLKKAWDGHFRAVTRVNGVKVGMLVDTGSSIVLLSYKDAEAAGLDPANLAFTQPVTTANGKAFVAPVTLEYVAVGDVGLLGVNAAVAEPGRMRSSLLGMSFLGRLEETSFRRDTLILRN